MLKLSNILFGAFVIFLLVTVLLQSGLIRVGTATPIILAVECPPDADICVSGGSTTTNAIATATTGSNFVAGQPTQVGTTWQNWQTYMSDGSINQYSTNQATISLDLLLGKQPLSLVSGQPVYGDLFNYVAFSFPGGLPTGTNYLGQSYFTSINVYEQADVYLNGNHIGTMTPINYATNVFTFTSYDGSSKLVKYQYRVLLTGSTPPNVPFTGQGMDLRSQIAALKSQTFNLQVTVNMQFTIYEECTSGRSVPGPCATLGSTNVGTIGTENFQLNLASQTLPFSYTYPVTPTIAGSVTTATGPSGATTKLIITVVETSTSFSTSCGPGCTVVGGNSGTTIITTFSYPNGPTIDWCDTVFGANSTLSSVCKNGFQMCSYIPWLCGTTDGISNWLIAAIIIVIVALWLLSRKGSSGGQTTINVNTNR